MMVLEMGEENINMSLEYLVVPKSKEALKKKTQKTKTPKLHSHKKPN